MSSAYNFAVEFEASLPKKAVWADREGICAVDATRATEAMGVVVSTSPPLGQVTQLASGEAVVVYAMLETRKKGSRWQMALHHTAGSSEGRGSQAAAWKETVLSPVAEKGHVQRVWSLQAADEAVERHYFRTSLAIDGLFQFTAKFREEGQPAWRWVRDEQGQEDGTVLINGRTSPTLWMNAALSDRGGHGRVAQPPGEQLGDLIRGLNPDLDITSPASQVMGTQLWCLEATVARSEHDVSAYTDVPVGLPWGDYLRWFALIRDWTPWLAPRQGRTKLELDRDAVLCSFLSPAGRHLVFLAVSGIRHLVSVLQSDAAGQLILHVRSDSLEEEKATVLVAVGDSFEQANAAVMYHAREVVQPWRQQHADVLSTLQSVHEDAVTNGDTGDVHTQWMETWYDGLGYCTWNGLGRDLSEAKLLGAMDDLAAHGIRIASLIIDDNWQALDRSGGSQFRYSWMGFEADGAAFPFGLGHAVQAVRLRHPHIRHVAVWHALLGYWGGVSPHGELAERYATVEVPRDHPPHRNLPVSGPMTVVAGEGAADVRRLYDDFYRFLAACGVDGVKTDAQFMTDAWASARARRELTGAYADAWAVAAMRHLQARAISCMSQTPTLLFHAQLPQGPPALPVRNSDDFYPHVPSAHPWHVWANAHNSLLTQHLNVLPDWDMFQTVHDYSAFHAAARCVSGGPIYITDVPGQHDKALLDQIAAPGLAPGRHAVVFRPSVVGRALDPYVGYRDNVLLKVGAYHGSAAGSGLLGLFNVSDQPLTELVPLARVPGVRLAPGDDDGTLPKPYLARVHSTGRLTSPVAADALLAISLGVRGHEIVSVYQPQAFSFPELPQPGGLPLLLYVAALGLVRKMAAAASVVRTSAVRRSTSHSVELTASFKALGVVGIYVSALPTMTVEDNFLVTIRGLPIPVHCVTKSAQDPHVLEVDAERAWDEMGQTPGWNNEVHLTVHITVG